MKTRHPFGSIWDPISGKYRPRIAGGDGEQDPPKPPETGSTLSREDLVAALAEARSEAAANRVAKREAEERIARLEKQMQENKDTKPSEREEALQQQLAAIQKALGIGPDGEADPEALQKALSEKDETIRSLRVSQALASAASEHGANLALLEPYLRGSNRFEGLDPDGDEFAEQVGTLVKETVEQYPAFKAEGSDPKPPQGSTGGDMPGGPGDVHIFTREELAKMGPDEYEKNRDEVHRQMAAGLIKS